MAVGAVILAAGAGMRLGGVAKALLARPDGTSFLAGIVATAREAGLDDLVVVVGPPHEGLVARQAEELGARVVRNPSPERGMASSVALGFAAIAVGKTDAAWLWPVDHPEVSVDTLRALVQALGNHDAARPVVMGRGGHPPLVARALWARLAACANLDGGARAVLSAADVIDVECGDTGAVRDIDTNVDLETYPG